MIKLFYVIIILLFVVTGCKSITESSSHSQPIVLKKQLTPLELQTWYQKDYQEDHIPGISLDKWYRLNKKQSKAKDIIVAVIDTQIDKNHEDLQGQLWVNSKEIPNNGIDDDHNGYIDDVNGWSFTGTKSGGYVVWNRYEYVRIIQEWGPLFKDKAEAQIEPKDVYKYNEYKRALKSLKRKINILETG